MKGESMRSFSKVTLAWFCACLVVLIGYRVTAGRDINMCRYRKFRKDLRKESVMSDLPTGVYAESNGTTDSDVKSKPGSKPAEKKPITKKNFRKASNQRKSRGSSFDVSREESNLTFNPYINDIDGLPSAKFPFMEEKGFVGRNLKPGNNAIYRIMRYLNPNDIMVSTLRRDWYDINFATMRTPYFQQKFQQLFENYNAISRMGNGIVLTQSQLWAFMWNASILVTRKILHKRFLILFDKYQAKGPSELQKFVQAYLNLSEVAANQFISAMIIQRPRIDILLDMVDKKCFIPNFGFIQYVADQARYIYQDDRMLRCAFPVGTVENRCTTDFLYTQNGHKVAYIEYNETDPTYIHTGIQRYNYIEVNQDDIERTIPGANANGYDAGLISNRYDYNGNMQYYFENPLTYAGGLTPAQQNAGGTNGARMDFCFGCQILLRVTPGLSRSYDGAANLDQILDELNHMMELANTLTNYATTGAINVFARGAEACDENIRFIDPRKNKDVESFLKSRIYYDGAVQPTIDAPQVGDYSQRLLVTSECGNGVNHVAMPNNNYDRSWRPLVLDPRFMVTVGEPSEAMQNYFRSQTVDYDIPAAPTPIAGQIDLPCVEAKFVTYEYSQYTMWIRVATVVNDGRLEILNPSATAPDHLANDPVFGGNQLLNSREASTAIVFALYPEIGSEYDQDAFNGALVQNPSHNICFNMTFATRHDWAIPFFAQEEEDEGSEGDTSSDDDCNVIVHVSNGGEPPVVVPHRVQGTHLTSVENWISFIQQAGPAWDYDLNVDAGDQTNPKNFFEAIAQTFDIIWDRIFEYDEYQSALHTGWHILDANPTIYTNIAVGSDVTKIRLNDADYHFNDALVDGNALIMGWTHFSMDWAPEGHRCFHDEAENLDMMEMYFEQSLLDVGEAYRVGNRICTSPFKAWNFVNSQGKFQGHSSQGKENKGRR